MAMRSIHCPVLGADVTLVADLEGTVTRVVCPEYDAPSGICRLKKQALEGGPLGQLLERMAEHNLDSRSTRCHLAAG